MVAVVWYVGLTLFALLGLYSIKLQRQVSELKALEDRILKLLMRRRLRK